MRQAPPAAVLVLASVAVCLSCSAVGSRGVEPSSAASPGTVEPSARNAAASVRCWEEGTGGVRPNADLYCIDLVPAPDLQEASGRAELGWVPTPFGVAVTRDGVHLQDVTVRVSGLPPPETLGPYTTYVVWATTPLFDAPIKLGEVANGRPVTGRVGLGKFLVLVSAEASAAVERREGRPLLRGTSASMRLPGEELSFLVSGAWGREAGHGPHKDERAAPATEAEGEASAADWVLPPMPVDMEMPPGMMRLRPHAAPFLPAVLPDSDVVARPSRRLEVRDGDTIVLRAGPVRRTILGRTHTMYGFEGQYPGPLVAVEEGATITVDFTNLTPFPSTVHWHGVRLDNRFDGVPGVTQPAVPPGGSFRYEVHFPDPGLYWYHPHSRESIQQGLGLYGNIFVSSARPDYLDPVNREEFVMLDDLLVAGTGLVPFGLESPTHALMGRFGNLLLVNGEPGHSLDVRRGEVVRFYLTNAAATRTFNVVFGNAAVKVVGSDLGLFERQAWVESVVIAPAERYVVDVRFDEPGEMAVTNRVQTIHPQAGIFLPVVDTLLRVSVAEAWVRPDHASTFRRLRENPGVTAEMQERLEGLAQRASVRRELILSQRVRDLPYPLGLLLEAESIYFPPVEWSESMPMMNWLTTPREVEWVLRDADTGLENMEIDWRFRQGDIVKVRIRNERHVLHAMQHPIHIHGQRFLVLSVNGVPNPYRVWKDTVLLPVGATADILLELSNPGRWMAHCHIAEHLEAGMMMVLDVEPRAAIDRPEGRAETSEYWEALR